MSALSLLAVLLCLSTALGYRLSPTSHTSHTHTVRPHRLTSTITSRAIARTPTTSTTATATTTAMGAGAGASGTALCSTPWDKAFQEISKFLAPTGMDLKVKGKGAEDLTLYDADIAQATALLVEAAGTRKVASAEVIESLLALEKLMRKKNKLDEGATSLQTLQSLDGSWRLIFTTGTVDTQKKLGKVNYFPIKAVQSFDTEGGRIANGIYAGDFAVLRFTGDFEWKANLRKLVFDFDTIFVCGLRFDLKGGQAAKIGASTGLGSEGNILTAAEEEEALNPDKVQRKPFFNWIS
eukprot:CAMPEP_0173278182 /NCGR_PEP_ID=MMETSP1143-20121109/4480_1 /TAXON_ID=483371 /ORGANISM="non described non described, Strain CCMP2298" /LENGTH=294 /DNA_ID=CAMNT_0014215329 /DNA_START=71 /DNA_END=952 /DNA_ORIENTATION=+